MFRACGIVRALSALLVLSPTAAAAGGAAGDVCPAPPCFVGEGDQFTGVDAGGMPARKAEPASGPGAPTQSPFRLERKYVPACSGNSGDEGSDICDGARISCPTPEQMRFWVFRREVDTRIPGHNPDWERVTNPPTVCLAPDDPVLDPVVAIPAIMRMSRVPWNFGGGPMSSGDVHEVILHEGSDSFADLALERGA
jgi:hypothetical protein